MLASSVLLGGLAGLALGGSWRNLRDVRIAWWPLAAVALALRVLAVLLGLPVAVHAGAILLTAAIAAMNWRIRGAGFIAAGSLLNALVIGVNGGMPFDAAAAASAGATPLPNDVLHHPIGPGTILPWLSDVVPLGLFRNVYSIGDFVIALGGFCIPFFLLRRR